MVALFSFVAPPATRKDKKPASAVPAKQKAAPAKAPAAPRISNAWALLGAAPRALSASNVSRSSSVSSLCEDESHILDCAGVTFDSM